MEASTRDRLRPARRLARKVLLPPLLAGAAVLCLLLAAALSSSQGRKGENPLAARTTPDAIVRQLAVDLEGGPTPADVSRVQKPLGERRRLLNAHPYFSLYKIANRRFGVSWYLLAALHYQETGFDRAPATMADDKAWLRHRDAARGIVRPTSYPHRSERHPSVKDDFDVVMAIAANLKAGGARGVGARAERALAARYGSGADGRLAKAMVIERARAWRLLGTLPLPGSGELATPVKGVVGGCGYFGCPRPGHLHNGVDFLAPAGTPIHAADAGVVASVESPGASGGYGNFVCIQHRPHLASCYAHLSAFAAAVRPGAQVKRGQVIGLVGSTGHSSAPHLHFEVRRGPAACSACAVDPWPMLSGDVPDVALPAMAAAAPGAARPASATPLGAAPAASAPAADAPVRGEQSDDHADDESAQPVAPTPARSRSPRSAPAIEDPPLAGGTRADAPPASAPQPRRVKPRAQAPAPPPPEPPASAPATGGAAPAVPPPQAPTPARPPPPPGAPPG